MLHKKIKQWWHSGGLEKEGIYLWGLLRGGSDSSFRLIFCVFMASILSGSVPKYRETTKFFNIFTLKTKEEAKDLHQLQTPWGLKEGEILFFPWVLHGGLLNVLSLTILPFFSHFFPLPS